ncbi:MAG TPA: DNA methyltransferase [Candidatus Humimicrobiaceae bacterium]|nr:DNA methyltransferase [Candidatus Humimicrobiaceae bacterium]
MQTVIDNVTKSFVNLRPNKDWSFADSLRTETNYITHGYHRYPAKFIPQIVQKLINEYTSQGDIVVDPFGGCGTTLVEAKLAGRKSYGFDINPVAKFITQAKITPIKPKTLENSVNKFINTYKLSPSIAPTINIDRLNYWFDTSTITELNRVYITIKAIKNYKVRRLYLCAFSHILKNCSRWLMKSTKPQVDPNKAIPVPIDIFLPHLRSIINRNNQFYSLLEKRGTIGAKTTMRISDSTKELPILSNSVDLIITSPPYVTSYEYADLHQLSLLWFGNDHKYFKKWKNYAKNFNNFRKKFIGTSLKKNHRSENLNSSVAERIVTQLSKRDIGVYNNVAHYFSDMNKSFAEMFRILKPDHKACIIIGDTNLQGCHITNSQVAAEQMKNIGFKSVKFIKREVSNKLITPWRNTENGRFTNIDNPNKKRVYQYEYILVMEKP